MKSSAHSADDLVISTEIGAPKLWAWTAVSIGLLASLIIIAGALSYVIHAFAADGTARERAVAIGLFTAVFSVVAATVLAAAAQFRQRFGTWTLGADEIEFRPKFGKPKRLRWHKIKIDSLDFSTSTIETDENRIVIPWKLLGDQAEPAKSYLRRRLELLANQS